MKTTTLPRTFGEAQTFIMGAANPGAVFTGLKPSIDGELNIISEVLVNGMVHGESSVFEGAQGMLLDEWHGFHPHTTWSTLTAANAIEILKEAKFDGNREIVGIIRSYSRRHGVGPFVAEDQRMRNIFPQEHNCQNEWQGAFRVGAFDGVQFRYALECLRKTGPVDSIALTHLDVFERVKDVPFCDRYLSTTKPDSDLAESEKSLPGVPQGGGKVAITRLIPNFKRDLGHQEALTDLLAKSEALRGGKFLKTDDLIKYIEANAKAKVKYLSFGPKSSQKSVLY
jgi:adenylosuccinate synthase